MEGQCNFFVIRKKRLCRMTVKPGALFCGEHTPRSSEKTEELDNVRVACPLDSKHTCFAKKLAKHLQVCNARQKDLPSYIVKNCNYDPSEELVPENCDEKRSLANFSEREITDTIAIVKKLYDEIISGNISNAISTEHHPNIKSEIENDTRAYNSKRHLVQISSLLNIMEKESLLSDEACFVELGAGRGQVSFYLAETISKYDHSSVLLIDRASHRHKHDNKLDKDNRNVLRIRADIADLVLSEVPVVLSSKKVVGVSKHLCGIATDLALRCLTSPSINDKTTGMIMATCCHHRCFWNAYTGKKFLEENGISNHIFDVICGIVSWATCGSGLSRERRAEIQAGQAKKAKVDFDDKEDIHYEASNAGNESELKKVVKEDFIVNKKEINESGIKLPTNEERYVFKKNLGLSIKEKTDIGFKAKTLLDWGRAMYLNQFNFTTKLCYYVESEVSPENVCIIATKI